MTGTTDGFMYFLGGPDLEMLTIRELLQLHAPYQFLDKGLPWGAKASDYRDEIEESLHLGKIPVLVELTDDLGLSSRENVKIVDHHGPLAGADKPTSLHQVFALLGLPRESWSRRLELVAANDRGHIAAMLKIGATRSEISEIRAADRDAQDITPSEEEQGKMALVGQRTLCRNRLTVVELPHNRTATVADRLAPELGGPGYANLLIISPDEINVYGEGTLIRYLAQQYPHGWYGGDLPSRGFFGCAPPPEGILTTITELLCTP